MSERVPGAPPAAPVPPPGADPAAPPAAPASAPVPAPSSAEQAALERLARWVAEDVADDLRRSAARAASAARRVLEEAETRVEALRAAAARLGAARGGAVRASAVAAGRAEAAAVEAAAFEALLARLVTRVRLALEALPGTPGFARALATWSAEAAACSTGPVDVHVEAALRPAVYEALLAAGVRDVRVHADPRVRAGFVVRDLDGRTLLDRRPEALVAERRALLADLLRQHLPPGPAALPDAPPPASA